MLEWKIAISSFASWYWLPYFETSFDLLKRGYVRHLSGQFVMSQVVRGLPMALAATSLQFLLLKAPAKGVIYLKNGRGSSHCFFGPANVGPLAGQALGFSTCHRGKHLYQVDLSHSSPSNVCFFVFQDSVSVVNWWLVVTLERFFLWVFESEKCLLRLRTNQQQMALKRHVYMI